MMIGCFAKFIIHFQQLVNTYSSLIASAVTLNTASTTNKVVLIQGVTQFKF